MPKWLNTTLRALALTMMAVAALFGIPLIIDPPPRDTVTHVGDADGKGRGRRKRRRS
jgi:hypothetical protein